MKRPFPCSLAGRFCAALLLVTLAAAAQEGPQPPLPAVTLNAGIHNIRAEVADNDAERHAGLMFRRQLAPQEGMLFVFDETALHCFWMKNTLLPLSIAFLADDGTVVNIRDMQPQALQSQCPVQPIRWQPRAPCPPSRSVGFPQR